MGLDLGHGVQRNAHDDQERRPAEKEGHIELAH
jgi:hypothetical protein